MDKIALREMEDIRASAVSLKNKIIMLHQETGIDMNEEIKDYFLEALKWQI